MKNITTTLLVLLSTIAFTLNAQDVFILNVHSQLEPMNRALTMGNKLTKRVPPGYSLVVDGKEADLTVPLGAVYFYVKPAADGDIRTWKLVSLKKGQKNTRHLPYLKSKVTVGDMGFLNQNSNYSFEQFVELDDVALKYERISDNLYKIYPNEKMKAGDYALIRMESNEPAEVYDFKVDKSLSSNLIVPKNETVLAALNAEPNATMPTLRTEHSGLLAGTKSSLSDVDTDIPSTSKIAEKTFALIISNEHYKRAESVPFANNDGNVFEQYLRLAIGVPESHITHLRDASLSDIKYGLNHIKEISDAFDGDSKIIIYYSGHGIPDEKNKDGYILPVDGYASDPTTAYKLSDLYARLNDLNSQSVTLFMDACFSGAQKSGSMIASARGVAIKVAEDKPKGNLVVFSAAQGDQTAYPYTEKEHGMMTYFLLKKLQETSGNATLGELGDYITAQVKRTSLTENGKSQTPVIAHDDANLTWRNQTLK